MELAFQALDKRLKPLNCIVIYWVNFYIIFQNKPKFFDAPRGDLNWVQGFTNRVQYIGGNISGQLIAHLRALNPELELMHFDITKDVFPRADIWHCRHCLFHLSLNDVYLAFNNFCKSDVSLALISNHFLPDCVTFDIPTGSFRFLDLTNFPFYLPKPDLWLMDTPIQSGKCSLASGIWTHAQIAAGAENYRKNLGL